MANRTEEQIAREKIDRMLEQAGWCVQDRNDLDWDMGTGIAIREFPTNTGPIDYALFVDENPCGLIEAKKDSEGQNITKHEDQTERYAKSKLKNVDHEPIPFLFQSTGVLTRFTNNKDPKPRSRNLFSFFRPETLAKMAKEQKSLRARLLDLPSLPEKGLRKCQIKALNNLEISFKKNRPRALVQMTMGAGKTYTAVTSVYRLLKFANAKRVLFLVDTTNLGEQAEQEFMAYSPVDDNRKFTELYNVQRLNSSYVATDYQVCISTIQRMYSLLRSEELDESAEQENPNERSFHQRPKEVIYNQKVPPEFFDFIIIDECHRSIYNTWRQVLEYFDAFLIGLTATPDKRTFGFFKENIVSEYTHEEAITDGVNVGYDIYTIETVMTKQGATLKAKEYVPIRDKITRKKKWRQLEDEVNYAPGNLDKEVVSHSQIRNVLRAFDEARLSIWKRRTEVPKTLIFAKSDSHADDIIQIAREELDDGNDFCKKVTYRAENPKKILADFRNSFYPRIAVTVDMIATGTDVKPLECLLFMRDVRSRNYFEQMKGRGTRTFGYDDLKKVTPSVNSAKTNFVIIDAVGVTKSVKTDSRPLERKCSVPMKELIQQVMYGADDENTLDSLAGRLARLDRQLNEKERERFTEKAKGTTIKGVIKNLLAVNDPDCIEDGAKKVFNLPKGTEPNREQKETARKKLAKKAKKPFNGKLKTFIEDVRRIHDQIMDDVNVDQVTYSGWDKQAVERAANMVTDFKQYLEENRDEITALNIFYSKPWQGRDMTYTMVQELLEIIKTNKPHLAPEQVWQAYEQLEKVKGKSPMSELTMLVSLVRRVMEIDDALTPFDAIVDRNFKQWVFKAHQGNA